MTWPGAGWHAGECDNCGRERRVTPVEHADPRIAVVCGPCLDALAGMDSDRGVAQDGQNLA